MRGVASASLYAAAPSLNLLAGAAEAASNWRGFVGCIKPRANDSSLVEMIRLLPVGIGVVPVYLNFTEGSREEFQNSYMNYEKNIAYLASQHCDTISIEGAPPFMILVKVMAACWRPCRHNRSRLLGFGRRTLPLLDHDRIVPLLDSGAPVRSLVAGGRQR